MTRGAERRSWLSHKNKSKNFSPLLQPAAVTLRLLFQPVSIFFRWWVFRGGAGGASIPTTATFFASAAGRCDRDGASHPSSRSVGGQPVAFCGKPAN
ncbi:hypothetical protein LSTR_LSTR005710 [Laodelphax striatellus]|uniref:Uncharacterized protein n=1 Tax=Laodelphax striatellus TaxID=195883 RepID=A0A482XP36_LAOST|nr:hypothetical protein LSTR_LSTR016686 [Laodelphax striatellus]RZF47693.1 hypothetical protein LSTR_LSTR005710 [Laodelphax striatellus]